MSKTQKQISLVHYQNISDLNFDEDALNSVTECITKLIQKGHVIYLNDLSGYGARSYLVAAQVLKSFYEIKDEEAFKKVKKYREARTKEKVIVVSNSANQEV